MKNKKEPKIQKLFKLSTKTVGALESIHEATGMSYSKQVETGIDMLKTKLEKEKKLIW